MSQLGQSLQHLGDGLGLFVGIAGHAQIGDQLADRNPLHDIDRYTLAIEGRDPDLRLDDLFGRLGLAVLRGAHRAAGYQGQQRAIHGIL